ncbi:MAG: hypothetical protein GX927_13965 [Lentisphaerae bacterium]|jgi:hypothetical protein|nr:hypothetical protein [Lentisphaerota bacterium]
MKIHHFLAAVLVCALGMRLYAETTAVPQTFVHSGETLDSNTDFFATKNGLAGHKYLIVDCSFRLKSYPSGFNFAPVIRFLNTSGKNILEAKFSELLPRLDQPEIVDGQEYIPIPPQAEKAALYMQFYGNCGEVELCRCDFTLSEEKERRPPVVYKQFNDPPVLDDRQLDEMLAEMSPVQAEIRRCGQYNGIYLNGKEIVPSIYYTSYYKDRDNSNFNMVYAYQKAGMNLFGVSFSLGVTRPCGTGDIWRGSGQYDISPIIRDIRSILKQAPAARILLRFMVTQYRGYAEAHPQEICTDDEGRYNVFYHSKIRSWSKDIVELPDDKDGGYSKVSDYSRHFRLEAAKAIEDVCALIAAAPEGKAVAMVYINGGRDGQWFDLWDNTGMLMDHSPAALELFREFLRQKYHNSEAELRQAWQQPAVTFDTARAPLRSEWWLDNIAFHTLYRENSAVHDFCEFLGWGHAQRHSIWCGAAKRGSEGRWLVGSYHRASGLRGFPQFSLLSLNYMIDDPNVDLFIHVPSYHRNAYAPVHQGGYDGSLLLHNKLMITEMDLRNGELPHYGRWGSHFWRSHNPIERFTIDVQRFAASAIEKGGTFHAFDMDGGWFNSPGAVAAWEKACDLLKARTILPQNNQHIGVFSSENLWHYQSLGLDRLTVYSAVENPAYALYRTGIPYKYYLLDELFGHKTKDFSAPKVMIFLNAGEMTPEKAEQIRKQYGRDRRMIVWHWAPGMFTTNGDKNIGQTTGFQLRQLKQADNLTLVAENSSIDPLLKNVQGFLIPTSRIPTVNRGVSYEVVDKNAKILARYNGSGLPGMAVKRYKEHTEVYIGAPCGLTPQLCRNFGIEAGLTPYLESDDFCGCNAGLLYVSALTDGKKVITLPHSVTVERVITGQQVRINGQKAEVDMKIADLLILKLGNEK